MLERAEVPSEERVWLTLIKLSGEPQKSVPLHLLSYVILPATLQDGSPYLTGKKLGPPRRGVLLKYSRQNTLHPGLIPGTKRTRVLGFPALTVLLKVTWWSRVPSREDVVLFASWVSLSHPQCPLLWSHHSFKVHQGGATEPSGAAGPHQHTYSFQEDHQTEPAAEAGGGARTQGECVLVGEDTGMKAGRGTFGDSKVAEAEREGPHTT